MVSKQEETTPASDIPILLKIGEYFIPKQQIRSITRFGKGTKIMLVSGDEILLNANYDKVCEVAK